MSELMEQNQTITSPALSPAEVEQYTAARQGPFYYGVPGPAYLTLSGPDQVDYLQRQTTNDMDLLGDGRSLTTVLTSPTARILDVVTLIQTQTSAGEAAIGILPLPGRGSQTYDYFRQRIFFMDKVTLEDHSADWAVVDLSGPRAADVLAELGFAEIPAAGGWVIGEFANAPAMALRLDDLLGERYALWVGSSTLDALKDFLGDQDVREIDGPVYEVLRVEAGQPGAQTELTESYTPFELGLGHTVSETKGCYTGQEVLARQVTYEKVVQQLVGLRLINPVEIGSTLTAASKKAGTVTSVVHSPRFGAIGLGVVRRPHDAAGTELEAGAGEAANTAQVVDLPFEEDGAAR